MEFGRKRWGSELWRNRGDGNSPRAMRSLNSAALDSNFSEYGDSVAKATDTMFSLTIGRDDEFWFVFHRLADEEKLRYVWGIGRAAFPPLDLTKATGR